MNLKKVFLYLLIGSLSLSALVAIFIFIVGSFNDIDFKILLTTLTIGGYSLTGLCDSVLYANKKYFPIVFLGAFVSILGPLSTFVAIWGNSTSETLGNAVAIFAVLAISIAHISLLMLLAPEKHAVKVSLGATIIFIALVALMIIYLVLAQDSVLLGSSYFRWLGVFAVLDALGTIITPILKKVNS
jgi:hypothetical protein